MKLSGNTVGLIVVISAALATGWYAEKIFSPEGKQSEGDSQDSAAEKQQEPLYWVAPMDANYRRDKPGKSPMGMDLVPVFADADNASSSEAGSSVKISPEVENNLGVRTATVTSGKLWRKIDTVGYVALDESRVSHIHLRVDGWIEKLAVSVEGERVKKGQRLFDFYSPKLVNAMDEYVQSMRSNNQRLSRASRDKLISLGVSQQQITQLDKTKVVPQSTSVYASQDGIVSMMKVREGMYVMPSTQVMSLADLSSVWVLAEVFESQSQWVKLGQSADVDLSYIPGRIWEGEVDYVYPALDAKNRTLKVRLRFDNKDESLKPNMYTNVSIYGGAKENVLSVPREALIRSAGNERLIIAQGKGRYVQREVISGMESGDWVEIKSGISAGEKIVTSAQFLIDSEASMRASLMRMSDHEESNNKTMSENKTLTAKGQGVVVSLMLDHGMITLQHDAIESLDWPAMEMDFITLDGVSLEGLASGDKVEFELIKNDDRFLISSIHKQGDMQ